MHDCWEQMIEGVLVEVPNTDLDIGRDMKVYWIATVLKICGKIIVKCTMHRFVTLITVKTISF